MYTMDTCELSGSRIRIVMLPLFWQIGLGSDCFGGVLHFFFNVFPTGMLFLQTGILMNIRGNNVL